MGKGVSQGAPTPSLWTVVQSLQTPAVGEALEGEGFLRPLLAPGSACGSCGDSSPETGRRRF